jgi:hypothetical protein
MKQNFSFDEGIIENKPLLSVSTPDDELSSFIKKSLDGAVSLYE